MERFACASPEIRITLVFWLTSKMSHGRDWRDSWLCRRRDSPGRWLWRLVGRLGSAKRSLLLPVRWIWSIMRASRFCFQPRMRKYGIVVALAISALGLVFSAGCVVAPNPAQATAENAREHERLWNAEKAKQQEINAHMERTATSANTGK